MTLTTVYVHGNGNKLAADALKRVWDEALYERDMDDATRMAYWAPLRYPQPLPGPDFDEMQMLPAPGPFESAVPAAQSPEAFIAETVAGTRAAPAGPFESGGPPGYADDELEDWLRRMTHEADALAAGGGDPFELLPLPRSMRTAAFRAMVRLTFKDVHAYFFGAVGEAIREVVRETLRAVDGTVVVIGHSLGSIVAYDVLREPEFAGLDLPLLVTVGSPLGITEVQDLVARPLEVPHAAAAWRNVCDGFDFVALDKRLRPAYAPAERVADFLVRNSSANHHGIREYLCSAPVREAICELTTPCSPAR
jgi:hypothetical protein